jgi:hypothetical protein
MATIMSRRGSAAGSLTHLSPSTATAVAVASIWAAVLLASLFSPDLIYDPEQKHLPIAAITWWFWGLLASAFVVAVFLRRRHDAAPAQDGRWSTLAVATGAIWLVAVLLSVFTERQITGADPTQFPVAAAFAPVAAMLATGFVAGFVAGLYGERTAVAVATIFAVVSVAAVSYRVVALPEPVRFSAPLDQFSSGRALPHLEAIARVPSPTGSVANARVRDYIIGEIRALGLTPEIQSTVAIHPDGTAFQADNVLVRLPGSDSTKAVLIAGHYDGIASGPGAGDNRLSNAAMLEAIRALQAREPLRNDVIFLFSDGEEYGLVGAQAFIEEHPWARDVGVVFNYDATNVRGAHVLMKTTSDDGWLVRNLVAADAGVFLKSQQNSERDKEAFGTDFDAFRKAGYTAADMNNWTNAATYHTRVDSVANLDEKKLQAYGDSMVGLTRHFGSIDLRETRAGDRIYTSIFDTNLVVHYPKSWTWPLTLVAAAGVAAVLAIGIRRRRLAPVTLALSGAALLGLLLISTVLAEVAWGVIKGTHAEVQWQQEVDIYQGSLLFGGLAAFVIAGFLAFLAWGGWRFGVGHLQAASLVLVLLVAITFAAADPFFSYVALWPLLAVTVAVGASLFLPEGKTGRDRVLRAGVFLLGAVPVLGVFVPLLWRGLVNSSKDAAAVPVFVLLLLVALLVSVIDIALPSRRSRRLWLAGGAVLVGVVLLGPGLARSGFNAEQPRPHTLFYTMNADTGTARWATLDENPDVWIAQFVPKATAEATTAEAVLRIAASPLEDSDWLIPSIKAWTSDAPALSAPAPTLTVLSDRREGDVRTLRLRVASPRGGRLVSVAPEQEVVQASVAGKPIDVYPGWRFVFVGVPAAGVELELVLRGSGPTRFTVFDQTDGLPPSLAARYSPEPEDTMPAILPRWARGYPAFVTKTYMVE